MHLQCTSASNFTEQKQSTPSCTVPPPGVHMKYALLFTAPIVSTCFLSTLGKTTKRYTQSAGTIIAACRIVINCTTAEIVLNISMFRLAFCSHRQEAWSSLGTIKEHHVRCLPPPLPKPKKFHDSRGRVSHLYEVFLLFKQF